MNAFRDGRVYVQARMCSTCIFRPGNLMHLEDGRLEEMVEQAVAAESTIVCHDTLEHTEAEGNSACRGFFDRHRTAPLQVAERLDLVTYT